MKNQSIRAYLVGALLAMASTSSAWALEINGASSIDLIKIGFSRNIAKRIVAHQQTHGDFQNVHDVLKVKGVTPSALTRVASKLTINGARVHNSALSARNDEAAASGPA